MEVASNQLNTMSFRDAPRSLARRIREQYRALVWPRGPRHCGRIREIALQAGGGVTLRCPAREQIYDLPVSADPAVLEFFKAFQRVEMHEEIRCTVPGGRVVGPGIVLSPDGQALARDVSVVFGGTADDHPMLHAARIPPARRLRGRTLSIASAGGESYYHWLIDEVPRFLEAAGTSHETMVGHRGHLQLIAAITGFRGEIIEARHDRHFQCDELAVSSLFGSVGHPTPEVSVILRQLAQRMHLPRSGPRRLFISRAGAQVRRLVHENEIWNHLESQGFERLFLERMAWEEQAAAFLDAEYVVAPHGAGLANLVFCRPGTRVVELFDRRYLHWCYWQLAAISGLEYHAIITEGDSPPTHDFNHMATDIDVRWDQLKTFVAV